MSDTETGGPAFPVKEQRDVLVNGIREGSDGLTIRDYFAAAALTGIAMNDSEPRDWGVVAYKLADQMLAARAALKLAKGE